MSKPAKIKIAASATFRFDFALLQKINVFLEKKMELVVKRTFLGFLGEGDNALFVFLFLFVALVFTLRGNTTGFLPFHYF